MITDPLLWFFAALGAFMVGVSKAGITGLSILSIALFNHVFDSSKQASGLVLPLLIFGDFVAVFSYRKHTYWRRYAASPGEENPSFHWSVGAAIGMTAGFITLVANAAGPLMALYLVAMRLPKMEYVGTAAVFFMLLNLFKVPFMVDLGLITTKSFGFNLALAPAVLLGAVAGRWLLMRVNQRLFEQLVLALCAIGGILLFL